MMHRSNDGNCLRVRLTVIREPSNEFVTQKTKSRPIADPSRLPILMRNIRNVLPLLVRSAPGRILAIFHGHVLLRNLATRSIEFFWNSSLQARSLPQHPLTLRQSFRCFPLLIRCLCSTALQVAVAVDASNCLRQSLRLQNRLWLYHRWRTCFVENYSDSSVMENQFRLRNRLD